MPLNRSTAYAVAQPAARTAMKLTNTEAAALAPYLYRLHQDDLESVVQQFRRLAHVARDRRLSGKPVTMPVPGNSEWMEWRGDLHAAGVIVSRIRDRDISDADAWRYADVYVAATEATRTLYLQDADGRCPALDELDELETKRESDPAQAWS